MRKTAQGQHGLSLMEIAFVIVIFSVVITAAIHSLRAVKQSKVKAFVIQATHIKNAADMFKQRYGSWPGDFPLASRRLKNCGTNPNLPPFCENGNGDQIVASSTSNGCRMTGYIQADHVFPCTNLVNAGNETAQFWRHLVLAGMEEGIKLSARNYKWGDGLPKVRMGGGFQVIYNSDPSNLYTMNFKTNVAQIGHYLSYQRLPNLLHRSFDATGDGPIAPWDTRAIDTELDDGSPLTGKVRSTGSWGCGNVIQPATENVYVNSEQMQCFMLYQID